MRVHRWDKGIHFEAENEEEFKTLIAFLQLFQGLKFGPETDTSESSSIENTADTDNG